MACAAETFGAHLLCDAVLKEGLSLGSVTSPLPKVKLGHHICYIAGMIILKDEDDLMILMTQERMPSCYGKWYLPMGRVEKNESIMEGAIRETKEETGCNACVDELLAIESGGSGWFRFTFTGEVTGGNLIKKSDNVWETIQSSWIPVSKIVSKDDKEYPLRGRDIVKLILIALERQHSKRSLCLQFSRTPHSWIYMRLFILSSDLCNKFSLLVSSKQSLPIVLIDGSNITTTIASFLSPMIKENGKFEIAGVLCFQHAGIYSKSDGFMFEVVIKLDKDLLLLDPSKTFSWFYSDGLSTAIEATIKAGKFGKIIK